MSWLLLVLCKQNAMLIFAHWQNTTWLGWDLVLEDRTETYTERFRL